MERKVLVCPIAYNEKVKIKNVIDRFLDCRAFSKVDYMVMDDGSDDGTSEVIASYANQGVMTLKHQQRSGVGAAIRTAIKHARSKGYGIIVIMAGNDKDDPREIPSLLEPIVDEGYDLVQGSRYLGRSGAGGDMPFYRKLATKLHPWFFSLLTGKRVTDTTNGFRAIRLAIFDDARINLEQEWLDTYELEPYILWKAAVLGFKYKEVFVTKIYPPKKLGGYTKMVPILSWWSILKPLFYLKLGIKK